MTPLLFTSTFLRSFRLIAFERLLSFDAGALPTQKLSGVTMKYKLADVVKCLNELASPSLAETWDNVGLLVEPPSSQQISKVLLTNDLTEDVLEETLLCGAQLVVSYHPPIFVPLKSVTCQSWKERIIGTLLENKIALYSPHTAWDSVQNGVNDWLAAAFGKHCVSVDPINQQFIDSSSSHCVSGMFSTLESAQNCRQKIKSSLGVDSSRIIQSEGPYELETMCLKSAIPQLVQIMDGCKSLKITKNEQVPLPHHGAGRKVTLQNPITLQAAIDAVKSHLNVKDVSVAIARGKTLESPVSSIVLCAGSGASLLKGLKADLYLTGEMLHHDVLDAVHKGTHVILTRHSNSERGYLNIAAVLLQEALPEIKFIISQQDRDPLVTV